MAAAEGVPGRETRARWVGALDPRVRAVARAVAQAGGRAVLVGGWVRDRLLGRAPGDVDVEVLGLGAEALSRILSRFGTVRQVGRSFGVLLVQGLEVDFVLPRERSFPCPGPPPVLETRDFATAARRRDLTINALGLDPLGLELLDPFGGIDDLRARRLRAVCAERFGDDPLRVLRVARLQATLAFAIDPSLERLCAELSLATIAPERVRAELDAMLLGAQRASSGLRWLARVGALAPLPELAAGAATRWERALCALDEVAIAGSGSPEHGLALRWAALLHAVAEPPGRAAARARALLERLRAPERRIRAVEGLVRLGPRTVWLAQGLAPPAGRRLVRELRRSGLEPASFVAFARALAAARGADEAERAALEHGAQRWIALARAPHVGRDVVLGRHVLARGVPPGPAVGAVLERCRRVQDETGWSDPERILDRALAQGDGAGSGAS